MTPIILLSGEAGSGKDTVAAIIKEELPSTILIAQADPMKRFASQVFEFTDQQLWGPSSERNKADQRFLDEHAWEKAEYNLLRFASDWIKDTLPEFTADMRHQAYLALVEWFNVLAQDHYDPLKALTPRYMLQTIGTEYGRRVHGSMWAEYTVGKAFQALNGGYDYDRSRGLYEAQHAIPSFVIITDGRFANEVVGVSRIGGRNIRIINPAPTDDAKKVEAAGVKSHQSELELKSIPSHFYDIELENDKTKGLEHLRGLVRKMIRHITRFRD